MSQQELLSKLVDFLDQARIPYMLTGSIASSLHGEPRSTHDVDVVVVLDPESITKLLGAFSEKQIHDALRIYEVQHGRLDQTYLQEWAKRLSVEESLRRIEREARPA